MNRDELMKMISLIDDDKLAEAAFSPDQRGLRPSTQATSRPVWQKALMTAAVAVIVLSVYFAWTKLGPGMNPTETLTTTTVETTATSVETTPTSVETTAATAETTTAATVIAPRWEEREVFEKYTGGAVIKGVEFQSSVHDLNENLIEDKLGNLRLTGYDIYTDQTYETDAAFYRIKDIDPDCVVAVRYEGYDGYYGFFNTAYSFETLADLIKRLDLPKHLTINNLFTNSVWHGDINKELLRWETYSLPDPEIVWDQLLARTDIVNEGEAARDKLGWEVMSISIDYAPAGQSNIGIVLFDKGYLTTNILWSLQSFYIGEDAVMAFKDLVLAQGTLEEKIGLDMPVETTGSVDGAVTTVESADGAVTTAESAAQTTQGPSGN